MPPSAGRLPDDRCGAEAGLRPGGRKIVDHHRDRVAAGGGRRNRQAGQRRRDEDWRRFGVGVGTGVAVGLAEADGRPLAGTDGALLGEAGWLATAGWLGVELSQAPAKRPTTATNVIQRSEARTRTDIGDSPQLGPRLHPTPAQDTPSR